MGFPTAVKMDPAPAFPGDFAGIGLRTSVLAGPKGLVAGAAGVTVGRFAWASPEPADINGGARVVNNFGVGEVTGFVHREQQALITTFLAESSNLIPAGFGMALMSNGDFWVLNEGVSIAHPGDVCYAQFGTGKAMFASGVAASASAGTISADQGGTFTGSIDDGVLTVTAGSPKIGAAISGTGGNAIISGTRIVSQLSGTPGGAGTYAVSIPGQTITSTTITMAYSIFTVAGTITGQFAIGDVLSGAGGGNAVGTGTTIYSWLTGAGALGSTAVVTAAPVGATTASQIDGTTNVATKWKARSTGAVGELVKITSWAQG